MREWDARGTAPVFRRVAGATALVLLLGLVRAGGWAAAADSPTADEYALLALTNEARSAAGLRPLVWNGGLGQAARAHSTDMAVHDCFQHDSCNGQKWSLRISKYYPSWNALGENITMGGSNPRLMHEDWMASPGHRSNILGPYSEFGAGVVFAETNFGTWAYATEDFGDRGAITASSIPAITSGGVAPRIGVGASRELIVSYYHYNGGAPKAVRALVGSSCVNLSRTAGSASNGTYGANRSFSGSGCVPVVFEAIRSDGTRHRWPSDKALLVGVGAGGLYCADWTTSVPTQDCGGGGNPVPTPTPTPAPAPAPTPTPGSGGTGDIEALRVIMKPGRANASKGQVQVQATLPEMGGFDPSSAAVGIHLSFAPSGDWSDVLPQMCGTRTCLKPNSRATVYRASWPSRNLSFIRGQDGRWKVRFSARNQTLGNLARGTVRLTLMADGRVFTASAQGDLKPHALVATD